MKTEEFFVVEQMIYSNFIQHNAASLGGPGGPLPGNLSIRHFFSCILVTFYSCNQLQNLPNCKSNWGKFIFEMANTNFRRQTVLFGRSVCPPQSLQISDKKVL